MAKKSGTKKQNEKDVGVPDGFDINVARERGDGWVKKEIGTVIVGRLRARFSFEGNNGARSAYQIELYQPAKAVVGEGDDAEVAELPVGAIINVDESVGLADLEKYSNNGGVYDVFIRYDGQRQIRKGQNPMWEVTCRLKQVKAPSAVPF